MPALVNISDKTQKEMDKDPWEELRLVKKVGEGHMSEVFLAVERSTNKALAVKVMNKELLRKRDAYKMATMEREILATLDHPFLPSLVSHFESENNTFLAMKYCSGGDVNVLRHVQPNKILSESAVRFYAAEVVLALEYLHERGIVYRDLKPENILVQDSGHIMLTDFDLSLRLSPKDHSNRAERSCEYGFCNNNNNNGGLEGGIKSHSLVGTEEYFAPEVLWCTGHAFPVDWWSLGVLMYEMSNGKTPFAGSSRKETFYNIMCREPPISGPWSPLKDLIKKLLVKEPSKRLGSCMGASDVKNHLFFRGLKWEALEFVSRPPFVPEIISHQHFDCQTFAEF